MNSYRRGDRAETYPYHVPSTHWQAPPVKNGFISTDFIGMLVTGSEVKVGPGKIGIKS